jgi:V/A-type H+-transporting ATPase subunit A
VYLQQNAFDPVDASTSAERQRYVFDAILKIMIAEYRISNNDEARSFMNQLRQLFLDWNGTEWKSAKFHTIESELFRMVTEKSGEGAQELDERLRELFPVKTAASAGGRE